MADPQVARAKAAIVQLGDGYALTTESSRAEIVLLLETGNNKFRDWARVLASDPVVMGNLDRCFVHDYTDRPVPFLPGLYWSMPRSRADPDRVVACDPWYEIPARALQAVSQEVAERKHLFSFRGFNSHRVRASLTTLDTPTTPITTTTRWWDYTETEAARLDYLIELRASSFVLCPRGLGTSTLRTYETMQLGRVPVIISDDWIPSPGPPWESFSIRVPERSVAEIPELLGARKDDAAAMGVAARDAWETFMRPGSVLVRQWLNGIETIIASRSPGWSSRELSDSWHSPAFQWKHNVHPVQGAVAAVRRGAFTSRLVARRHRP